MKKNKISVGSIETYLVHVVRVVEWNYPPGSSGVVLVSCDARQPPLQHLISDLLRVDPSGVVKTRVQPHGWSRAWSGWMRLRRKTSSKSIPVTPSRTSSTTQPASTLTGPFPPASLSEKQVFQLGRERKGEVRSTALGSPGPDSKTRSTANRGPSPGK